jgi:hypothetical protein
MGRKFFTDTGADRGTQTKREITWDNAGGQQVEVYVIDPATKAAFYAGTLPPYTGSSAPFALPAASVDEVCEDGILTITIRRDFGYDNSGTIVDPTTADLDVRYEILGSQRTDPATQIEYLRSNQVKDFPNRTDVNGGTEANRLKNIRLRTLLELLKLPQGERPSASENYLPAFASHVKGFDPAWDSFLLRAGTIPGNTSPADDVNLNESKAVTINNNGANIDRSVYLFGRGSDEVTATTVNDNWTLAIPVSHLLGGDESNTPATLQNGGVAWPEFGIYQHAFENGVEGVLRYDYILRKTTSRSNAYAAQHALQNVGKIKPHANILAEIGAAAGDLVFSFSADFTGTGWLKQAPDITFEPNNGFTIRQDYINLSVKELNTNFYPTF